MNVNQYALRAALQKIVDMRPAAQETTCAHEMAEVASDALTRWFGASQLEDIEREVRKKIVTELRSSAFLYCDVNKEDVLLCIEHGRDWVKFKDPARQAGDAY